MQKTKIGVSVGLFAAALYFIGLIGPTPLVLAVGYVLVAEQDPWLKKAAIRAVGIVVAFAVLSSLLGLLNNSTNLINNIILLFRQTINLSDVTRIIGICQTILRIIEALILLTLGFKAIKQSTISLGVVDKVIDSNM
jgi:4-amino-4-deoxy-L-arabinose transferase-like glycosyltransferase